MKQTTIIVHIPHSKTTLPKAFYKRCLLPNNKLEYYIDKMTDSKLLEFFGKNSDKNEINKKNNLVKYKKNIYLYFPSYSRLFIDMERYSDDSKELMANYGQGVVYTKTYDNTDLINYDESYKNKLVNKYYKNYHNNLRKLIIKKSKKSNIIIIDLHSFGADQVKYYPTYIKDKELPDVNIGFNNNKTKLYDYVKNQLENQGYKISDNYPYEGTYIAQDIGDINIDSIMIELNKNIYLNNLDNYNKTKETVLKIIDGLL